MQGNLRERKVIKIAQIGFIANIFLMIFKLWLGYESGSNSLFVEGINSATDVFSSLVVLTVLKFANQPADEEHPYGHGKAEIIASLFVGVIILIVSLYITFETLTQILNLQRNIPELFAMYVAFFATIIKIVLYKISMQTATKYHSKAIEAIAYDHKSDIISSTAVTVGIIASVFGEKIGWTFLLYGDQISSFFVIYLLLKIAKKMIVEAFHLLLDRSVQKELVEEFLQIIKGFSEVKRIDNLRAREVGHNIFIDLRISVEYDKTIKQGHDLARLIKRELMKNNPRIIEVLIHINPYFTDNNLNQSNNWYY